MGTSQPTLESVPASPTSSPSEEQLYTTLEGDDPFGAYADSSYMELDPKVPTPSFNIPSDASLRREKMRRLKRKLGDNIPVHLVFPPIAESDEEDVIIHSPTTPTFDSSDSSFDADSSCDSSLALITDSEREQDVVSPLPSSPQMARPRSRLRHEGVHQPPRKSHFADSAKPLPPLPLTSSTTRTIKRRSGQFIIHYEVDEYAVGTCDGLKCAVAEPVDTMIGYAI